MVVPADASCGLIKLSARDQGGYWEIPVLFEDEHLLAIDKPAGLLTSPDRYDPSRPNLMRLLHTHIAADAKWARARGLGYLANAHRLDFETSGILLLAKTKPALQLLANQFGCGKPEKTYFGLAQGTPPDDAFSIQEKLGPHPGRPGIVRIDPKNGKWSQTDFRVVTRYLGWTWLECRPLTGRTHQIRAHLQWMQCPLVADRAYGGAPLWLSELKRGYRVRRGGEERPLLGRVALHAAALALSHPVRGELLRIESPLPKDLRVALKYLDRFALPGSLSGPPADGVPA